MGEAWLAGTQTVAGGVNIIQTTIQRLFMRWWSAMPDHQHSIQAALPVPDLARAKLSRRNQFGSQCIDVEARECGAEGAALLGAMVARTQIPKRR